MKTIRRLLYGELLLSVLLVTLGFLSLFYFFDFVDELKSVSQYAATGYTVVQALLYVACRDGEFMCVHACPPLLRLPSHSEPMPRGRKRITASRNRPSDSCQLLGK